MTAAIRKPWALAGIAFLALCQLPGTVSAEGGGQQGKGPFGLKPAPKVAATEAPPAPAEPDAGPPVAVLLFHGGTLDMEVEEGGIRTKAKGVLRIPLDAQVHSLIVRYTKANEQPASYAVVAGRNPDGSDFIKVEDGGIAVAEEKGAGGNLFAEVEPRTQSGWQGNFLGSGNSNWLGYGNAARWRLRSVPAGAQVAIVSQSVSTDIDIARLESKYIRTLTFTKPGYQPCGFAEARISQEETAGLSWTVITCVLKRTGP